MKNQKPIRKKIDTQKRYHRKQTSFILNYIRENTLKKRAQKRLEKIISIVQTPIEENEQIQSNPS